VKRSAARENPQQEEKYIFTRKENLPKRVQKRNSTAIAGESCQKTSAAAGRSSLAAQLLRILVAALRLNSIEFGRSGTVHGSTVQIFLQGGK
jgi:hypothetical protein